MQWTVGPEVLEKGKNIDAAKDAYHTGNDAYDSAVDGEEESIPTKTAT